MKRFATLAILCAVLSLPTSSRASVRDGGDGPIDRIIHRIVRLVGRVAHALDDYPIIPKP